MAKDLTQYLLTETIAILFQMMDEATLDKLRQDGLELGDLQQLQIPALKFVEMEPASTLLQLTVMMVTQSLEMAAVTPATKK